MPRVRHAHLLQFRITRVCVVADRGMISAETIVELEAGRLLYILGVRERTDKLLRELVLDDPAPFVPLVMKKRGKEIDWSGNSPRATKRWSATPVIDAT
jgi:hypothetical protein